jgi:hypothetical protein
MNKPAIDSAPSRSAGRPDTISPNNTSDSPEYRLKRNAHAACTSVCGVN